MATVSSSSSRFEQLLTSILAVVLLIAILGGIVLSAVQLGPTEPNTGLYLLNTDGIAAGYQTDLTTGETGRVVVGVQNNEGQTESYTLVAHFPNREITRSSFTLDNGESEEITVEYTPQQVNDDRVVFELYRGGVSSESYRGVDLKLTVNEPSTG